MKNLEKMGVQEMNAEEMKEDNGGLFWEAVGVALLVEIFSDWENFKKGLSGQPA